MAKNTFVGQIPGALTGSTAAEASGNLANAQLGAAQKQQTNAMQVAAPTEAELTNLNQQIQMSQSALQNQQKMLDRQGQLLDAIDPTLKEAATQAYQLLQGKEASSLAPMKTMIDKQRAALTSQLADQLGPGYATSSAGQAALRNFDDQAAMTVSQTQQQALGTLLGQTNQGAQSAFMGSSQGDNFALQSSQLLGQNAGMIQQRQLSAITGNSLVPYAGAPFVGDLAKAQGYKQFTGQVLNGAAQGGMMGAQMAALA